MASISCRRSAVGSLMAVVVGCTAALLAGPQQSLAQTHEIGRWVEAEPVDGNPRWSERVMHAIHLSTRQVLLFYGPDCYPEYEEPRLYDIISGVETSVPTPGTTEEFTLGNCQGHAAAEHWILIVGGSCGAPQIAVADVYKFHTTGGPPGGPWEKLASGMSIARWYPSLARLHDSRFLVFGGTGFGGTTGCNLGNQGCLESPHVPEIYDPATNQWDTLENAVRLEPWPLSYPFIYQIPDGRVACIGPAFFNDATSLLDITGEGEWTDIDGSTGVSGDRGSAVMYEPGKVLMCGGWIPLVACPMVAEQCPIATRETGIIDLSGPDPESAQWVIDASMDMAHLRRDHNLVVTPGGQIVVVGGVGSTCVATSGPEENCFCDSLEVCNGVEGCVCCTDDCDPVFQAEWIDPSAAQPVWSPLAEMTIPRGYHSVAVLLPDASILVAGGEEISDEEPSLDSAERFEPPYLFSADGVYAHRPVIGYAPSIITYGSEFTVRLPNTPPIPTISKVCLIRPAAVSHGFDQDQRRVPLTFQQVGAGLVVDAPPSGTYAPPGHYMLFIVDSNGVPSVARYLRITTPMGP